MLWAEKIRRLWIEWEIRVLVLLSLCLQIFLIIFGSRRKCTARSLVWISVWSAYLMADWVASFALGNLARNQGDSGDNSPKSNNLLQALWAPFLLLHLGGPDTITAYALEDNELWLRRLLELVFQVGVAFYVFLKSWSNTSLTFIAIPVFTSGIIKYGERTFVLWSSCAQRFKDSLFLTGDISPELIKIMLGNTREELRDHGGNLVEAYFLFKRFAYLFAGLLLSNSEANESSKILEKMSAKDAFSTVEIELGFMYDVLYTKTTIVYSRLGIILRFISFLNSVSALVVFSIMIDVHDYFLIDISITYLLLVSAVVLEVYASILQFLSDWTKLCLIPFKRKKPEIYNATCSLIDLHFFNHERWSGSMGQFNLLSYCLEDMPIATCLGVDKLFRIDKFLGQYMLLTWEDANADLKEFIFNELMGKIRDNFKSYKEIFSKRGELGEDIIEMILDLDFDGSLLAWHLATDICFYDDFNKGGDANNLYLKCKNAKSLSGYMLYLLLLRPSMMPKRIFELRTMSNLETTITKVCDTIRKFAQSKPNAKSNKTIEVCKVLLELEEKDVLEKDARPKDNIPRLVAFCGCDLAKRLQSLESQYGWDCDQKWRMISEVWVEMLGYAAIHCEWKEHAQQLRKGGELLTHVCLLMAHLGISQQYRFPWDM